MHDSHITRYDSYNMYVNKQGSTTLGQGFNQEYKLFVMLAFIYVSNF